MEMEQISIKQEIPDDDEEEEFETPMIDMEKMIKVEIQEEDVLANITDSSSEPHTSAVVRQDEAQNRQNGLTRSVKLKRTSHNSFDVVSLTREENKQMNAVKKRKRMDLKVELERERRRELTELYDELYFWVRGVETAANGSWDNGSKLSYNDKMTLAIDCIKRFERTSKKRESEYEKLVEANLKLKAELTSLNRADLIPDESHLKTLYKCDFCPKCPKTVQEAFLHVQRNHYEDFQDKVKGRDLGVEQSPVLKLKTQPKMISKPRVEGTSYLLKCRHCSTITNDKSVLQIHNTLHKDLLYLICPWPACDKVFGVPSKLKTHHFLAHESVVLPSSDNFLSLDTRTEIVNTLILHFTRKGFLENRECTMDIENFLEATTDAMLVREENQIEEDVENMNDEELEGLFLEELQSMIKAET